MGVRTAALSLLILAGCSTPYQPFRESGGYSETRIDANTYLVWFSARIHGNRALRNAHFLHRCAEVTKNSGFDYFVIQNYEDFRIIATYASGGGIEAYIKLFKGRVPVGVAAAYEAQTVLRLDAPHREIDRKDVTTIFK